jgi:hypothetical protein
VKTGHLIHIIYTITVIVRQVSDTALSRNQFCLYQYPVLLTQPKRLPTTVGFEVYPTVTLSVHFQCCGSGSDFSVPDPGSRVKNALDPRYGTATKNVIIFNAKNVTKLSEKLSGMFIPNPVPSPSQIPDPDHGVKKAMNPGSGTATLKETTDILAKLSLYLYQQKGAEPGTGSSSCSICFLLAPLRSSPRVEPKKTYSMDGVGRWQQLVTLGSPAKLGQQNIYCKNGYF